MTLRGGNLRLVVQVITSAVGISRKGITKSRDLERKSSSSGLLPMSRT